MLQTILALCYKSQEPNESTTSGKVIKDPALLEKPYHVKQLRCSRSLTSYFDAYHATIPTTKKKPTIEMNLKIERVC